MIFLKGCIIYNDGEYLIARRHEHEFMYIKKINGVYCAFKDLAGHNKNLISEVKKSLLGEPFYYNQLIEQRRKKHTDVGARDRQARAFVLTLDLTLKSKLGDIAKVD